VTISSDKDEPYVDAARVKSEIGDLGEVVVMPTNDVSWAFSHVMPDMTQVYGGAGRGYGTDRDWIEDPYRSPLRFAFSARDSDRVVELLVSDVMTAAMRSGLLGRGSVPEHEGIVEGVVRQIVEPSAALVELDDDQGIASLRAELLVPGLSISRLVQPGQRVRGAVHGQSRRLDVRPMLLPAAACLSRYRAGDVILARVRSVAGDTVLLEPHPDVVVEVGRDAVTDNPADLVSDLFTPGETVLARVVTTAPAITLRLDDIDDDTHAEPPALLEGGPPWLGLAAPRDVVAARSAEAVADTSPREAAPSPAPAPGLAGAVPGPGATGGAPGTAGPSRPTPASVGPHGAAVPRDGHDDSENGPRTARPDTAAPASGSQPRPTVPGAVPDAVPSPAALNAGPPPTAPTSGAPAPSAPGTRSSPRPVVHAKPVPVAPLFGASAADTQGLRQEVAGLQERLQASERARAELEIERNTLRTKYRETDARYRSLKKKHQALKTAESTVEDFSHTFTDPEEQFCFELYLAWARRVPAGQKADLPFVRPTIGPDFLESLESVPGVSREKVLDVVVEIVTGLVKDVTGRDLHQLRSASSGGAPYVTREDGAVCWRVALQRETAQARRLHYWAKGDEIELSRVALHDDMTP